MRDIKKGHFIGEQDLFRAVHRRLTFLCAAITISILCLFSCLYLYLAERTLQDNHLNAFRQDMSNLSSSLEQQAVITHVYLSGLEQNSGYQIYLWDQGLPFRFNEMPWHTLSPEVLDMLLSRLPWANAGALPPDSHTSFHTSEGDSLSGPGENGVRLSSPEETLRLPSGEKCSPLSSGENWALLRLNIGNGQEYQIYLSQLSIGQPSAVQQLTGEKLTGVTLLVASPSDYLREKIWQQRLRFLLIDLAGILLLIFFAAFFTRRMLRPLRESHDCQIRFVADASHELRTPLAVIRACMHARPPAYEQTVDQECARMGRLIEDLLTLSRLETVCGQRNPLPERQDVDLDTLLLTVYEQMELLSSQKKISLRLQLPPDSLPSVQGDRYKLEQLLTILLQNALHYTPAGGKVILSAEVHTPSGAGNAVKSRLHALSESRRQKKRRHFVGGVDAVSIRVTDNGPGISDADKTHIFERFYRAQRSHTDRSHFGLGLCIAREIALAHGGSLTVTDAEGGGAVFCLTLRCGENA